MCIDWDPLFNNLQILSGYNSVEEVKRFCLGFGPYLVQKCSFQGHLIANFQESLSWIGLHSSDRKKQEIVRSVTKSFEDFVRYLQKDLNSEPPKALTGQIFTSSGQARLEEIYHRLTGKTLPDVKWAMRDLAPSLLQDIIGNRTPTDLFQKIIQNESLSLSEERRLRRWVKDLKDQEQNLSPRLIFAVFERAIQDLPQFDENYNSYYAYILAWQVYAKGLRSLTACDKNDEAWKPEALPQQAGKEFALAFPLDFPIRAYESDNPEKMIIVSPAPLFIGMWKVMPTIQVGEIPIIRSFEWDKNGRWAVVDKVLGSLDDDIYDKIDEQSLLKKLSGCVKRLLQQTTTPQLKLPNIFVTHTHELCSFVPLVKKHDEFFLPDIEKFICQACKNQPKRIKQVLNDSKFCAHDQAKFLDALLQNWGKILLQVCTSKNVFSFFNEKPELSDSIQDAIRIELQTHGVQSSLLKSYMEKWVQNLRVIARRVHQEFKTQRIPYQNEAIIEAILALQKQKGFLFKFPENIHVDIVQRLKNQHEKPSQTS